MTDEQYANTQAALTSWARATSLILGDLELDEFASRLQSADTLAYVIDPTLAMRASDGVRQVEALTRLAMTTVAELRRLAGLPPPGRAPEPSRRT